MILELWILGGEAATNPHRRFLTAKYVDIDCLSRNYGLDTIEKILVWPMRSDRIRTGGGRSAGAIAAVAPVALRALSVTAAGTLPMRTIPPYCRQDSAHRIGTR